MKKEFTSKTPSVSAPQEAAESDKSYYQDWRSRRDAAIRHYHSLGLQPIPLRGKQPYTKGWNKPRAEAVDINDLLRSFAPTDNVGLLCGIQMKEGQYLRGIDYDDIVLWNEHANLAEAKKGYEWLEQGGIVRTGSGKCHHYVLSDSSEKFVFLGHDDSEHGGEIQGAGTQLVAPPSIHPDTKQEYEWYDENWENLPFVPDARLRSAYVPTKAKSSFLGGRKKQPFSAKDALIEIPSSVYFDYSTIDFIALFRDRGWVMQDKGDRVTVLCPNHRQHSTNTNGESSTVILRTSSGGQRFKCLHGHCGHLSDRDELVKLLGGPEILKGYAKEKQASTDHVIREADPDLQRRMDESFHHSFPKELPPLPTIDPPPPTLTVDILPEPLASYCKSAAVENETTPEAIAGFILSGLGIVTGTKILIAPDLDLKPNWFESPVRSTALVMPVSANKTAAFRAGLLPLEGLQKFYDHQYKLSLRDYEQTLQPLVAQRKGLIRKLESTKLTQKERDEITNTLELLRLPEAPSQTVLVMNRATPEKILQLAANGNERGFLLKADELVGLIEQTTRQGNEGLREFYIEAMTVARNYSNHTIGRGSEFASALALSLAGCVQPSKLRRLLRDLETGFKDDGLLQRFLWIWPDQPTFEDIEKATQSFQANNSSWQFSIRQLFEELEEITPEEVGAIETDYSPAPFCYFGEEAQRDWRKWRRILRGSIMADETIPDGYKSWLGKSERLVAGLALSFHFVECVTLRVVPGPIGPGELGRAIDCWEILSKHAHRVFSLSSTTVRESLWNLVKKLPKLAPEFSIRELKRKGWAGLKDDGVITEAVEWLCDLGYLQEIEVKRTLRGRPASQRFNINPAALVTK